LGELQQLFQRAAARVALGIANERLAHIAHRGHLLARQTLALALLLQVLRELGEGWDLELHGFDLVGSISTEKWGFLKYLTL
jgi:hypothetical protein